jgi:hypothetical protein
VHVKPKNQEEEFMAFFQRSFHERLQIFALSQDEEDALFRIIFGNEISF